MKKVLLLALPLMAVCFASCEKDNGEFSEDNIIQFEDAHFLRALLTVQEIEIYDGVDWINYMVDVDTNRDGQISVNEAKIVRGLDLFNFNVQSIPEIKYFTSLTYLYCTHNQLTSLDVSNNTALRDLFCAHNQLTSLDVSTNPFLLMLNCGNNQLETLIISQSQQNASWLESVRQQYPDIEIIVK